MNEENDNRQEPNYWKVFFIGIVYILALGLFTYLFNNPI